MRRTRFMRGGLLFALFAALLVLCAPLAARAEGVISSADDLTGGVNVISTGVSGETFDIGEDQALMIATRAAMNPSCSKTARSAYRAVP